MGPRVERDGFAWYPDVDPGLRIYYVKWGRPDGQCADQPPMELWILAAAVWPNGPELPPDMHELFKHIDSRYSLYVSPITNKPPAPKWSQEAKGRVRRKNMERRITKKAPLFAAELIEKELSDRPGYFAGENYNAGDPGEE